MLVLAAVSDLQYQRLRTAVGATFSLARAATWDDALETIRGRPVEIAVVDPMLGGARGQEVERLRVLFPSLPLILYTPMMTPELAPALLAMGKCGITQVVLSRTEDHPARLRELLGAEALHATSNRLLAQLTMALAPLPPALRWCWRTRCGHRERSRRFSRWRRARAWIAGPARGGVTAPACRVREKSWRRPVCCMRTAS